MNDEPLKWQAETLWEQLEPLLPGLSVEVVARSPSTNTALLERARVRVDAANDSAQVRRSIESSAFGRRAVDVQPCLLVAEQQTQGRGRMGRVWQAAPGASLTFSLSLPMDPPDWSGLSLVIGMTLAEALDPIGANDSHRIGLKWPNDLWLLDTSATGTPVGRKLGGVLVETVTASANRLAIIGIGLNIHPQPTEELSSGYACLQELDPLISAPTALARVAKPLVEALTAFNREGFAPVASRFAARDLLRGRAITTTQADLPEGVAQGVTDTGALRIQTDLGIQTVSSGEVSVRLNRFNPQGEDSPC